MSAYIQIGSGKLYTNPTAGNLAVNPTPLKGFTVQDVSVDISGDIKELRGQNQFADDTATTDKKLTGKFGIGRKDLTMFNQIFFADTISTTGQSVSPDEVHAIPATPFTVTVAPPATGTFLTDLGVSYQNSSIELIKVASSPITGQYSVNASTGAYLFAAADTGLNVLISYAYTLTGHGATYQVNNQVIGYGPQVEVWIVDTYQSVLVSSAAVYNVIRIYAAKVNKITIGNKRADYSIPEVDWAGFASSSGRVLDMYSVNG
jgi:hypothetical protein